MPLYIRDDEVDALAVKLQEAIKAPTKTEAVRLALQHELDRQNERLPPSKRIEGVVAEVRKMFADAEARAAEQGLKGSDDFDLKAFTDEGWGDI